MMRFTSRNPAVSAVITTNGKRPELLRVAVRSILEQSYRGYVEVVVVFDRESTPTALRTLRSVETVP